MKRTAVKFVSVAALVGGIPACLDAEDGKPDRSDVKQEPSGKDDAWGPSDSPNIFTSDLVFSVAELPLTGQAASAPWAGSYWPVYQDAINYRWDGANSESPAAKYGRAFNVTGVEDAVSQNHGIESQRSRTSCTTDAQCDSKIGEKCSIRPGQSSGRCIPTWFGLCHAWAPAAIMVPEPKYPVTRNGVTFKVQDIKALVTLAYNSVNSKFVSLRCNRDESSNAIHFDEYGRPTAPECRDTNAGTYHVLLTNYLGLRGLSFVEDRTYDDEVWNQPLRAYRITRQREVSAAEANRLIGATSTGGTTVNRTGQVAASAWSHQGSFAVTAGTQAVVNLTGSGDADLYVNFGAQPTTSSYACRPYTGNSNERCELVVPAGATQMFVSVHGYTASDFQLAVTTGGAAPSDYIFNANARKFFEVNLEVDFIAESPSNLDGNLAGNIDRYTHTDRYSYVLEVDGDGKIIGGEWVGSSKTDHPDFLWLPTGVRGTTVAGGKITYAQVKSLLDESLLPPGQPPVTGEEKQVADAGTLARGTWKHLGPFSVAPGKTLTATLSGTGDVDLYVRKGGAPTLTAYDCRPYRNGSAEECTITGPGEVYVSVNGYASSSNYQLDIRYTEGSGAPDPGTPPPSTVTHLNTSGTVAQGEMKVFTMDVIAGRRVVVRTASGSDVDLYVQMNAAPTTSAYLYRGYTASGNETLTLTPSSSGKLHIGVHGYQAGSFTLRTADN